MKPVEFKSVRPAMLGGKGRQRLTVGTILKESVEASLRFAAWYLAQGADRIVMCFDDPRDPAADLLSGHDRITVIRCTRQFWQSIRVAPELRFTKRQNRAMNWVYHDLSEGWFLNVDADELLHLEGRLISEEVAAQPEDVRALRVAPAEHIQTPDADGLNFRLAMPRHLQRTLYGDLAQAMKPRHGLFGHTVGKSITRAGLKGAAIRQHWAQMPGGGTAVDRVIGAEEGGYLLHFTDQGYDVWRHKIDWRLSSRGFRMPMRQKIEEILDLPDPEPGLRALYELLHVFDADRFEKLTRAGASFGLSVDPDAIVARELSQDIAHAA